METSDIKGYSTLTDKQKELYRAFLYNFRNRWESEIEPISVNYIKRENCLKFVFRVNGREDWLKVISPTNWY